MQVSTAIVISVLIRRPSWAQFVLVVLIHSLLNASLCCAEGPKDRNRLFNGFALAKAEQRRDGGGLASRVLSGFPAAGANQEWENELESVSDVIDEHRTQSNFMSEYRAPMYLTYLYGDSRWDIYDESENRALAERALLYQTATSLKQFVLGTGLEPFYRSAVNAFRWVKDYTSLKVQHSGAGALRLREKSDSEKPLFELKLRVSANDGVQPCVDVGDNFSLRHDVLRDETIVEFRKNF